MHKTRTIGLHVPIVHSFFPCLITHKVILPSLCQAFLSSMEHKIRGAGSCTPPAGGKKAWLGCPPAGASCARSLHPPELLHSCPAGRSAAADRCAAVFPVHPQRTLDIALALHCPERQKKHIFSGLFFLRHSFSEHLPQYSNTKTSWHVFTCVYFKT